MKFIHNFDVNLFHETTKKRLETGDKETGDKEKKRLETGDNEIGDWRQNDGGLRMFPVLPSGMY
jgi:hypothetical protein